MPAPIPTRPSVRIIQQFTYRGATQEFSNRYFLAGGVPADDAAWLALVDDIMNGTSANLLTALSTHVTVVKAIGYEAGSEVSVWMHDYSDAGVHVLSGNRSPGDAAVMCRWTTDARTSKGHPIYLFKYFHSVSGETGDPDTLESGLRSAFQDYAQKWWDAGYTDGTNTYRICGPFGAVGLSSEVDPYVRHRDFPT